MKTRRVPIRTCVVCRQTSAKKTLLRVIRAPEKDGGGVAADPTGRATGRGAYVCASPECIEKAVKQKRFERSLSVVRACRLDLGRRVERHWRKKPRPAAPPTGATANDLNERTTRGEESLCQVCEFTI